MKRIPAIIAWVGVAIVLVASWPTFNISWWWITRPETAGRVTEGVVDAYPFPLRSEPIRLSTKKTNQILGTQISAEQAKNYLIDGLGYSVDDAEQGVARFSSVPGQATAYMVGMLRILELRERAKAALGDRFDLKQFHNQILGKGKIPLSLLEQVVEDWIQQKLLEPASP